MSSRMGGEKNNRVMFYLVPLQLRHAGCATDPSLIARVHSPALTSNWTSPALSMWISIRVCIFTESGLAKQFVLFHSTRKSTALLSKQTANHFDFELLTLIEAGSWQPCSLVLPSITLQPGCRPSCMCPIYFYLRCACIGRPGFPLARHCGTNSSLVIIVDA